MASLTTNHKGMDAMRSHRTLLSLAIVAALTGCRSNAGGGWALWNPFSSQSNETAVASTGPTLPSQKFAMADKSSAPAAKTSTAGSAAPAYVPPAAVARAAAATPTAPSSSAATPSGAPNYNSPTGIAARPAPPASNSLASSGTSASANPSGPYNPNGYQPTASMPTESPASSNRYGTVSRYDTSASTAAPTTPMAMPPATPAPTSPPSGDRYATYESAAANPAPTPPATTPSAAATPVAPAPANTPSAPSSDTGIVAPASATVNINSPAGQYRPGGTTSYPINSEQLNVASLPEKPASPPATGAESTTPTPGGYPSTGSPEPGSIYGMPSYR